MSRELLFQAALGAGRLSRRANGNTWGAVCGVCQVHPRDQVEPASGENEAYAARWYIAELAWLLVNNDSSTDTQYIRIFASRHGLQELLVEDLP